MALLSAKKKYKLFPGFSSQSYTPSSPFRTTPPTHPILSPDSSKFRGISSPLGLGMSGGAGIGGGLMAVNINRSLLNPIESGLDPEIQHVKAQEKEEIKGLNNKFAHLINKVCALEQQNQVLATKWSILQGQKSGPSNVESMLKAYISKLQKQLEGLGQDKLRLEYELGDVQDVVEEFSHQYEEEINNRTEKENEYVLLKKDVDGAYVSQQELEFKLQSLIDEIDFLKHLHAEELREVQAQLETSNTSVVISVAHSPRVEVDSILAQARAQYEEMAEKSRGEVENKYRIRMREARVFPERQYKQIQEKADRHREEIRAAKAELNELTKMVNWLHAEIASLKEQNDKLEAAIAKAEEQGKLAAADATENLQQMEQALQKARQDMVDHLQKYQELLNIKVALDVEIATYRKLLEGEELRLESSVQNLSIQTKTAGYSSGLNTRLGKFGSL